MTHFRKLPIPSPLFSRTPSSLTTEPILCSKIPKEPAFLTWVSQFWSRNQTFYSKHPSLYSKAALLLGSRSYCCDWTPSDAQPSTRAVPSAVAAVRAALTDYLHSTRGLHFTDAEHIGGNSPIFINKLLKKVGKAADVGRAVTRFFRYNPINEFEPFFESLGLTPAEFTPLLPRDLMFLSDDESLLENYRVLCNYGIARGKIGRIYKEAAEAFRYGYGVLASKLEAYERLGLDQTSVIRIIASSPVLLVGEVPKEFLKVLEELEGIGIEKDWIGRNICDKDVYNWGRMISLLQFFMEVGFTKQELRSLINKHPGFILEDSGKAAFMLVGLMLKFGGTRERILRLLSQFPQVQLGRFMNNLWNGLQFLIEIEMDPDDIQRIMCNHVEILGLCSLKKPNSILTHLNIGKKRLCGIIKEDPYQLKSYALGLKLSPLPNSGDDERSLLQKSKFLMSLGFVEDSKEMNKALKVFRGKGDELQDRYDFLINTGLDPNDVSNMIKMAPHVLNQKKDVLQSKIDFLVNGLGYPITSLVTFPSYMSYTVERVKLRFLMYNWLKDRGKASPGLALSSVLACSDKMFLKRFISHHPEGPKVWENLKKGLASS